MKGMDVVGKEEDNHTEATGAVTGPTLKAQGRPGIDA